MACPKCQCKVTYQYDDDDFMPTEGLERCAACGHIFHIEDSEAEDDEEPIDDATRYALGAM